MSKKTRKKSSKTAVSKPARAKSSKSTTAKKAASKAPATRTKAAPKAAKGKAAKVKVAKAKTKPPAKVGRAATLRGGTAASPKTKPAAAKSNTKAAARAVKKPADKPAAPRPAITDEIATESIRSSGPLTEGMTIPNFKLPRDGGDIVSLAPKAGRTLVIFFYPRADTPGCTKEAMDFSRLAADFDSAKTDVVGVSADPLKAQEAFRNKHELTVPLLSDEPHDILESFGVWGEKSMYGRTFFGVLRTTVVVGSDRKIRKIWHNVKVDGHADEVLEYVKSR